MPTQLAPMALQLSLAALLILSAATFLTATAFRRSSAAARHLIWTAATLAVLLLPAFALVPTPDGVPADLAPMPRLAASLPPLPVLAGTPTTDLPAAPAPQAKINWSSVILWGYVAVFLACLAPLLLSPLLFVRVKRRSVPATDPTLLSTLDACRRTLRMTRPIPLLLSADPRTMPLTFGVARPHVLLPADAAQWPDPKLRLVLSHELAHVKRRDCLTLYVAQIVRAVHWFNPLAHRAVRQMCAERERACDDLVLAATAARPSEYADTLLHLTASLRPAPLLLPAMPMARASHLHTRLLAILDPRHNRSPLTRRLTVAVLLLAPVVALPLACTPSSKSTPHPAAGDLTVDPHGWTQEMNACQGPMRDITLAATKYAHQHERRLPPTLGDTLPYVDRNHEMGPNDRRHATPAEKGRMYVDPRDHASTTFPDAPTKEWVNRHTSYTYLGAGASIDALSQEQMGTTVLLHDDLSHPHQHPEHGPTITCAYLDGHSEGHPIEAARKIIAQSKLTLAAAATTSKAGPSPAAGLPKGWTQETIRCASQLRQIGQYIILYANDNDLRLPPDLGATLPFADGATDAERAGRYLEPRDRTDIPAAVTGGWVNTHTSYKYLGLPGVRLHDLRDPQAGPAATILAVESLSRPHKDPEQGAVVSALYADGHVELLTVEAARKQVERSAQVLKKLAAAAARGAGRDRAGQSQNRPVVGKAVPFETGDTTFLPGDSITIERVLQEGAAASGQPGGGIYTVSGTYTLASRDSATLALHVTSQDEAAGTGSSTFVSKGTGAFTLRYAQTGPGHPHVSFYPDGRGGESFGGVYFGPGDTLRKRPG